MSVTIKDIAKRLGVSYSSVSRALNNKPGVSKETRERILAETKRIGYQPNAMARGLVSKKSNTIGVIIPDLVNSYFGEVTQGIIDSANDNGYTTFLCVSNWDTELEKKYLRSLQEKRVDGIILKLAKDDIDQKYLSQIKVPFIILEGWPGEEEYSCVKVDNKKGAYMGTKFLIERGYKHIAFAGGRKNAYSNTQRLEGYKKALREHGIEIHEELIGYGDFSTQAGYELAGKLLNSGYEIDAIFSGSDVIALGVLDYASTYGYRVPEELGVIGLSLIHI